ncbi:MAG: DUF3833 family protein [Tabrizicola sp.]|nr:DUF3833 family protein [Tabrizicola sp.]
MKRRFLILGGASLALAGCASAPSDPSGPTRPVTLVSAFGGQRTGTGVFRIWLTGEERRFTARLAGRVTGKAGKRILTVVEDFAYDDGQTDRLTWVFRETGPGRWTGTREDTVGAAVVTEENGRIRLTYTADFRSLSGVTRLGFADLIYARDDGVIINDGIVSRAGIPVAAVRFVIRSA